MNENFWDYQKELKHVWKTYHKESIPHSISLGACISHKDCPGIVQLGDFVYDCNCICHLAHRKSET